MVEVWVESWKEFIYTYRHRGYIEDLQIWSIFGSNPYCTSLISWIIRIRDAMAVLFVFIDRHRSVLLPIFRAWHASVLEADLHRADGEYSNDGQPSAPRHVQPPDQRDWYQQDDNIHTKVGYTQRGVKGGLVSTLCQVQAVDSPLVRDVSTALEYEGKEKSCHPGYDDEDEGNKEAAYGGFVVYRENP